MSVPEQPGGGERLVGQVRAGRGGAMTDEVGVVTGDLTVATTVQADGLAAVTLQYTGAEEWYTLTGSPVDVPAEGLQHLHDTVLDKIRSGGGARAPR
ncbi:hypothetical protein KVH23_32900 [Streptomyces olivaceus]|nr:hypothetical protein [Streptomyces olivaceus]MBZ6162857.1 hypothetical protein [Streptomyces olivaceus]MBZ6190660.1 hypothetical protein [Streptomyces olivaceus]MBZ6225347.1 hypothetical protein [Streptomyces olivaceus]MBZ6239229.1 hypothetical protein [Streptomyces olivaceus]